MVRVRATTNRYATLSDVGREMCWVTADQVPQLQTGMFKPVLDRLGRESQDMSDRMFPVELSSGESVILVLSEYVRDDAVIAMQIAMQQAGLKLAHHALVIVSPSVLSTLTRKSRTEQRQLTNVRATGTTPGHVLFSLLDDMLVWAIWHKASDLHLTVMQGHSNADVAFSIRSHLQRPEQFSRIATDLLYEMLAVVWMRVEGGNGAVFEPLREQQGRLERWVAGQPISLRWASIASHRGPSVTLRILGRDLDPSVQTLESLGYCKQQLDSFYRARLSSGGAVILAGTVGSGKSTTLATLIRSLPINRKVMTLEDPIEFEIPNAIQCAVTSFGEGEHDDERFDIKLRAIKRSAANDVLIGEVRDRGSARALADLLVAGTNVYTTIHAGSALQIVQRLRSPMLGVCDEVLSVPGVIKLLVYQVLLNALCVNCSLTAREWLSRSQRESALGALQTLSQAKQWLERFLKRCDLTLETLRFRQPAGCDHCRGAMTYAFGYGGILMSAEMIEPRYTPGFQEWLQQVVGAVSAATLTNGLTYETCQQVALRYVAQGKLDPREFELRFGEF